MRDKLIEMMSNVTSCDSLGVDDCRKCKYREELDCKRARTADYLIANGVTVQQWIPVSERLPEPFVSVLVQMPDEEPCPTVREGYLTNNGTWYAGYFERETSEVTHWMPMPKFHNKEEQNNG